MVAMQFEITDPAAIAFASELYAAVADGYPLDAALPRPARPSTPTATRSSGPPRCCTCGPRTAASSTSPHTIRTRSDEERAERERAELERAELERAELERAELERAELERAELERAELERAELERAELERAELERAELGEGGPRSAGEHSRGRTQLRAEQLRAEQLRAEQLVRASDGVDRAEELLRGRNYARAIAVCAAVRREFGNSADPALAARVARARELSQRARQQQARRRSRRWGAVGIAAAVAAGSYLGWRLDGTGPEERRVELLGTRNWTDTGVDCKAGEALEIAASGSIYHSNKNKRARASAPTATRTPAVAGPTSPGSPTPTTPPSSGASPASSPISWWEGALSTPVPARAGCSSASTTRTSPTTAGGSAPPSSANPGLA